MRKKKNSSRRNAKSGRSTTVTPGPAVDSASRLPVIDALRGAALVMMFAYHFSFDLNYFGVVRQDFYQDAFWIAARSCILASFLALTGISLALATVHDIRWPAYWRRLAQIAVCATLVSAGSYLMFPKSWIYFGVLHCILVASVLGLAFLRLTWANLVIGAALIAAGVLIASPLFDHPWLNWFGLMTHKPITEEYVPLLPWFGVVLLGIFAGRRVFSGSRPAGAAQWAPGALGRPLAWAGRHSLILYMVHQPLILGALYLLLGTRH